VHRTASEHAELGGCVLHSWVAGPGKSQEVTGLVAEVSNVRVMAKTLLFADVARVSQPWPTLSLPS